MPPTAAPKPGDSPSGLLEFERGDLELRSLPDTFSVENSTVELVWGAGARVKRWHESLGYYLEDIPMDRVDLSRLKDGASVLDSHWRWSIAGSVGFVEDAWVAGGKGLARIKFGSGKDEQEAARKVRERVISKFSIGYDVEGWERSHDEETGLTVLTATRWTPYEISLVTVPADPEASVRSQPEPAKSTFLAGIRDLDANHPMTKKTTAAPDGDTRAGGAPAQDPNPATPAATASPEGGDRSSPAPTTPAPSAPVQSGGDRSAQEAVQAERERAAGIEETFTRLGIDNPELKARLLKDGTSLDQARALLIEERAKSDQALGDTRGAVDVGREETEKIRSFAEGALLHRIAPTDFELDEGSRDLAGMGLQDMYRLIASRNGLDVSRMGKQEMCRSAFSRRGLRSGGHTTGDFPHLLGEVGRKTLLKRFQSVPRTYEGITEVGFVSDFKPSKRVRLSDAPQLSRVTEGGEYEYGSLSEEAQTIKLAKSGVIVPFTLEMMINDDLNGFASLIRMLGLQAGQLESSLVWGVIAKNKVTGDGKAFFHADHKNLGTGQIDLPGVSAAKKAMRSHKDTNGTHMSIPPVYIAVPTALEEKAQLYLKPGVVVVPTKAADANIHRGTLEIIVEPRLDEINGAAGLQEWYVFANGDYAPAVELVFLEGQRAPSFQMEEGFDTDSINYKVRHYCEAGPSEWRGGYKSDGNAA